MNHPKKQALRDFVWVETAHFEGCSCPFRQIINCHPRKRMVLVSLLCPLFPRVSVDGGSGRPKRPGVQARWGHGTNTSTAHPIHLRPSYRVIGACSAAFKAVGRTIHPHEVPQSKKTFPRALCVPCGSNGCPTWIRSFAVAAEETRISFRDMLNNLAGDKGDQRSRAWIGALPRSHI